MPRPLVALVALAAVLLLAAPALAKKPKPPPCDPGTFVVTESEATLLPEADPAGEERIEVGADGTVSVSSGCPDVQGKLKTSRKGTKVSAKWGKGFCQGLPKKVKLKASFDASCQLLTGKLKSKRHKRTFTAERVVELQGFGRPSLEPVLEEDARLTRTVGPEGDEILTWGADGTTYRLRIPAGALPAPTPITITPVLSIGNLPLEGGLLQAVDLQPAGLAFAPSATLTITPPEPLGDALLAGFGWTGDENAFEAAPWWVAEDGSIRVQVDHFSGYGIGIPGDSQLDTLAAELLALQGTEAALVAAEAPCLGAEAVCTPEDHQQLADAWFEQIVDPLLLDGDAGPVEAIAGHEALRAWLSALQSLGLESALSGIAIGRNLINLIDVFESYTPPDCSGDVVDWRDWIRVPQELHKRAQESGLYSAAQLEPLEFSPLVACAELALGDLSFPTDLANQPTELPLSFQTVVKVEGEADVGVATEVNLFFEPGASGDGELETTATGQLDADVSREPLAPRVAVEILAREPATGVFAHARVVAGDGAFAFEDNLADTPPPIVPTGATRELCVISAAPVPAGTSVSFEIEPPGSLAGSSAPLAERGDGSLGACVSYQAPAGPVGRLLAGAVTATLAFEGETWTDTVAAYPHWKDVSIGADVGGGLVDASNATVGISGDSYALRARVVEAGENTASAPLPVAGEAVFVETDESTLLGEEDDFGARCCRAFLELSTDAEGRIDVQWRANDSTSSEFPIQFIAGSGASFVAAGVTLRREPWELTVSLPTSLEAGTAESLRVVVREQDGAPVSGARIDLAATGGTLGATSGTTDGSGEFTTTATLSPGETTLTVTVEARQTAGGAILASETVVAVEGAGGGGGVFTLGSFEWQTANGCTSEGFCTTVNANTPTELSVTTTYVNPLNNPSCTGLTASAHAIAETDPDGVVTIQGTFRADETADCRTIFSTASIPFFVAEGSFAYTFDVDLSESPRNGGAAIDSEDSLPGFGVSSPVVCVGSVNPSLCPDPPPIAGTLEPGAYSIFARTFSNSLRFTLTLTP